MKTLAFGLLVLHAIAVADASAEPSSRSVAPARRLAVPVAIVALGPRDLPAPHDTEAHYASASEALKNLYFEILEGQAIPDGVRSFVRALTYLVDGQVARATGELQRLVVLGPAKFRDSARKMLVELLGNAGRYRSAYGWAVRHGGEAGAVLTLQRDLPEETVSFAERAISDRLVLGPGGLPLIEVRIRNRPYFFVFDTGAAYTTLSREVADSFGILDRSARTFPLGNSVGGSVTAQFARLPEIRAGSAVFRDHTVLVVPDLTLPQRGGARFTLEGILGWNAIRHVKATLDFDRLSYRIERSVPVAGGVRNFFWLGYPLVRLTAGNGQRLLFGYDSGSSDTSVTENIFKKLALTTSTGADEQAAGIGGTRAPAARVLDRLSLIITGHRFLVSRVDVSSYDDAVYVATDGILGSDVAQSCLLTVDFPDARLTITPPQR